MKRIGNADTGGRGHGWIIPALGIEPDLVSLANSCKLLSMGDSTFIARAVRAMTSDGQIRLSALDATPLWDGVRRGHPHLDADACAPLVELLSSAALLQSRSLLTERIQLFARSSGRAKAIVADSWPDGSLRGILDLHGTDNTGDDAPWIGLPGQFQVIRSKPAAPPFIGTLELVEGPIAKQVEHYLQQSEQVQACISLWCDHMTGEAGGLIAEPLPDCPPSRVKKMLAALDGVDALLPSEKTPEFLVKWVNQGEGAELQSFLELEYRCRCSKQSLIDTLGTMPLDQRGEFFAGTSHVDAHCEYCGKHYEVALADLPGTLPGTLPGAVAQ